MSTSLVPQPPLSPPLRLPSSLPFHHPHPPMPLTAALSRSRTSLTTAATTAYQTSKSVFCWTTGRMVSSLEAQRGPLAVDILIEGVHLTVARAHRRRPPSRLPPWLLWRRRRAWLHLRTLQDQERPHRVFVLRVLVRSCAVIRRRTAVPVPGRRSSARSAFATSRRCSSSRTRRNRRGEEDAQGAVAFPSRKRSVPSCRS